MSEQPVRRVELEFDEQEFPVAREPMTRLVRSVRDRFDEIWKRLTAPNPGEEARRRSWMGF